MLGTIQKQEFWKHCGLMPIWVKFDIIHIICILIMLDALWHSIKVFISSHASFLLYPYIILIM